MLLEPGELFPFLDNHLANNYPPFSQIEVAVAPSAEAVTAFVALRAVLAEQNITVHAYAVTNYQELRVSLSEIVPPSQPLLIFVGFGAVADIETQLPTEARQRPVLIFDTARPVSLHNLLSETVYCVDDGSAAAALHVFRPAMPSQNAVTSVLTDAANITEAIRMQVSDLGFESVIQNFDSSYHTMAQPATASAAVIWSVQSWPLPVVAWAAAIALAVQLEMGECSVAEYSRRVAQYLGTPAIKHTTAIESEPLIPLYHYASAYDALTYSRRVAARLSIYKQPSSHGHFRPSRGHVQGVYQGVSDSVRYMLSSAHVASSDISYQYMPIHDRARLLECFIGMPPEMKLRTSYLRSIVVSLGAICGPQLAREPIGAPVSNNVPPRPGDPVQATTCARRAHLKAYSVDVATGLVSIFARVSPSEQLARDAVFAAGLDGLVDAREDYFDAVAVGTECRVQQAITFLDCVHAQTIDTYVDNSSSLFLGTDQAGVLVPLVEQVMAFSLTLARWVAGVGNGVLCGIERLRRRELVLLMHYIYIERPEDFDGLEHLPPAPYNDSAYLSLCYPTCLAHVARYISEHYVARTGPIRQVEVILAGSLENALARAAIIPVIMAVEDKTFDVVHVVVVAPPPPAQQEGSDLGPAPAPPRWGGAGLWADRMDELAERLQLSPPTIFDGYCYAAIPKMVYATWMEGFTELCREDMGSAGRQDVLQQVLAEARAEAAEANGDVVDDQEVDVLMPGLEDVLAGENTTSDFITEADDLERSSHREPEPSDHELAYSEPVPSDEALEGGSSSQPASVHDELSDMAAELADELEDEMEDELDDFLVSDEA